MIAQAVTELDNKTTHCQPPVLDRHTPFFRRIPDRQINNLPYRVICREHFAFFNGRPDHAVQRFDSIRGVDGLADIRRITEERIEVFPVRTPAFADLRIFIVPFVCERCVFRSDRSCFRVERRSAIRELAIDCVFRFRVNSDSGLKKT